MAAQKIGRIIGDLAGFGPEAVEAGDKLADARIQLEDAERELRRLNLEATEKEAIAADQAAADAAYAAGDPVPGPVNVEKLKADRLTAEPRLRAARQAEAELDADLYAILKANTGPAHDYYEEALQQAADDHRAAIDALLASRARLLEAEHARRYVDGVDHAALFEQARPEGWQVYDVWPVSSASRPKYRAPNGNLFASHIDPQPIDKAVKVMREECDMVMIRPETEPYVAPDDKPHAERAFGPKPRARRRPRTALK